MVSSILISTHWVALIKTEDTAHWSPVTHDVCEIIINDHSSVQFTLVLALAPLIPDFSIMEGAKIGYQ
jgi:hypothetical protein